jgi:hypothetical protein
VSAGRWVLSFLEDSRNLRRSVIFGVSIYKAAGSGTSWRAHSQCPLSARLGASYPPSSSKTKGALPLLVHVSHRFARPSDERVSVRIAPADECPISERNVVRRPACSAVLEDPLDHFPANARDLSHIDAASGLAAHGCVNPSEEGYLSVQPKEALGARPRESHEHTGRVAKCDSSNDLPPRRRAHLAGRDLIENGQGDPAVAARGDGE